MTSLLAQKVALVTGSSSGIGAAVARSLAAEGARVVVNSRSSVAEGERVADEIGGIYLQADVSDPEQARRLVDDAVNEAGRLDILVNNAGTTRLIPHHDLEAATPEIWAELYATNVIAPFVLTTAAVPHLRAGGAGCVVNVGSIAGVRQTGSSIPYAASKAALHHQTRLLANVLGPEIRVNAVAPGLVDTPWTADWVQARQQVIDTTPLRTVSSAEDVAHIILGLVTSRVVTGDTVLIDAGMHLNH